MRNVTNKKFMLFRRKRYYFISFFSEYTEEKIKICYYIDEDGDIKARKLEDTYFKINSSGFKNSLELELTVMKKPNLKIYEFDTREELKLYTDKILLTDKMSK